MNELAGQSLGRYHLEEEIGRGAMGVVYQGKQLVLGRKVAIKVLPQTLAQDASYVARFTREARIMAGLNHPNIVQIYDAGRQNKHLYFVMEFIQGPTLASLLYLDGIIPPYLAVEYAAQIAEALDAAYREYNVIHRDIKPENLMLNRWGKIKVMDFGLARASGLRVITVAKTLVGSIYYASPEQIWGIPLDNRSDIYALGVVLYEMVSGHRPFTGRSMIELTQTIAQGYLKPPREYNPDIPVELEHIILKALARDREQRYADAGIFAQELRALSLHTPATTTTPGTSSATNHGPLSYGAGRQMMIQHPKRPQARPPIALNNDQEKNQPLTQDTGQKRSTPEQLTPLKTKISKQKTLEIPTTGIPGEANITNNEYEVTSLTFEPKSTQGRNIWDQLQKLFKQSTR